jgi:hypothetical protein
MIATSFAPFDLATLDADPSTVLGLAGDLSIAYVNPAYWTFARVNGAAWAPGEWGVGAALLDAVPKMLKPFYGDLFERSRQERAVVEHDYECSSPEIERRFRLRVLPCEGDALVLIHSLIREVARSDDGPRRTAALYTRDGIITQCSHCRRVERREPPNAWEWVLELVQCPAPNVSHGLCPPCIAFYYGTG